ncbi:MAG: hypothetical protein J6T98_03975 [Salinivirgaceae bacterium]|nr:hypothetical protein [Salinivirgaceae bacterium]
MKAEINFKPWIGEKYLSEGFKGKRILVLGESVHCGDQCSPCCGCYNFTIDCVKTYVENNVYDETGAFRRWTNTYKKFESALVGESVPVEERQNIWNSIAFYNYFQTALDEARQPLGGDLEYDRATECLTQIINELKPKGVIVWGMRLWRILPDKNWTETEPFINEGLKSPTGFYTINNRKFPFMAIYHPSVGFSWDKWHVNIKRFIEMI